MARQKKDGTVSAGRIIDIDGKSGKELSAVSKNMRKFREQLGMEQKELSKALGMSDNTVGNWERGYSKPPIDMLLPICGILGMTLYDLFGVKDPSMRYSAGEQALLADYRELSIYHRDAVRELINNLRKAELMEEIPEITELIYFGRQLAAGVGDPSELYDEGEPMYFYSSELVDKADFVFTVNGESMEPEYHSGEMVLVQKFPDCGDLRAGEIGAFMVGSEAYIKEYQPDGLHSLNKKYSTMKFTQDDKVFLIGRVIGTAESEDIASAHDVERYAATCGGRD
ncbi:LexA family transcriptional regulator [uncultured Ruminococcus sp.]|uniref:helix-turn-helix domain-containing protein n=1 Tax=uncultured Ruminococcus sp. TaxID=165186 RepID=UPI0025F56A4F|nr:LexA family transcriptional regulator [uncultured Ruminococcus sp.]